MDLFILLQLEQILIETCTPVIFINFNFFGQCDTGFTGLESGPCHYFRMDPYFCMPIYDTPFLNFKATVKSQNPQVQLFYFIYYLFFSVIINEGFGPFECHILMNSNDSYFCRSIKLEFSFVVMWTMVNGLKLEV